MSGDRRILSTQSKPSDPMEVWGHWSLLILIAALLAFLGWGFVYAFCDPHPTRFQTIVFFGLLTMIFLEAKWAGLYGNSES